MNTDTFAVILNKIAEVIQERTNFKLIFDTDFESEDIPEKTTLSLRYLGAHKINVHNKRFLSGDFSFRLLLTSTLYNLNSIADLMSSEAIVISALFPTESVNAASYKFSNIDLIKVSDVDSYSADFYIFWTESTNDFLMGNIYNRTWNMTVSIKRKI